HASCLLASPPRVVAKPDMAPRAAYAPSSSTLYVKPGDLSRLVVFHELAHHLDFACGAAEELGEEFRAAQGIAADKPWWKDGDPVTWPAEYFANAVAEALGEETRHRVTDDAVALVEEWLGRVEDEEPVAPAVFIGGQDPRMVCVGSCTAQRGEGAGGHDHLRQRVQVGGRPPLPRHRDDRHPMAFAELAAGRPLLLRLHSPPSEVGGESCLGAAGRTGVDPRLREAPVEEHGGGA